MPTHSLSRSLSDYLRKLTWAAIAFFCLAIGLCLFLLLTHFSKQSNLLKTKNQAVSSLTQISQAIYPILEASRINPPNRDAKASILQTATLREIRHETLSELNRLKPLFVENLQHYARLYANLDSLFSVASSLSGAQNFQLMQTYIMVMQDIERLNTQLNTEQYEASLKITNNTVKTTLALIALLITGIVAAYFGMVKWAKRQIKSPFSSIQQRYQEILHKSYPLLHHDRVTSAEHQLVLHILQSLIDTSKLADELANTVATQSSKVAQAERLNRLGRLLPGIAFKMRYTSDGAVSFPVILSDHIHDFFYGKKASTDSSSLDNNASTPVPHISIPLTVTNGIVAALHQAKDGAIDINSRIEKSASSRWIRTVATLKRHDNGDITVHGIWLDTTDMLHRAEILTDEKNMAENIAKEKASFLAMMSHEIRTPLNGMLGMTQVVLKADLATKERERIEKIYRSGEHLLNIVNDVLDFSKMESDELTLEHSNFSLQRMLCDVGDLMSASAAQKNLEFWIEVEPNVPDEMQGDPYRLRQILLNYISNAIKFTPAGEVWVHVKLLEQTNDKNLLRFEVSDTGIGISAEQQTQLFQAFKQTDASITRRFGGTGLGLAISRKIAHLLNGETGMQSAAQQGSLFWFTAWIDKAPQKSQHRAVDKLLKLENARILIAESQQNARKVLQDILRDLLPSAQIEIASTGKKTRELLVNAALRQQPYDICMISSYLPDIGALAVIKQLQAEQKHSFAKATWLIIAADDVELLKQAEECRFTGVLAKPLTRIRILNALQKPQPRLPLPTQENAHQLPISEQEIQNGSSPQALHESQHSSRILVVDDNELNRIIAQELLQAGNIEVETANHGQIALDMLEQHPADYYCAILMDMQMPVMDGYTATRHIREQEKYDSLPIIALTAHITNEEAAMAKSSGIDDFMAKPVIESAMWATLEKWHIRPDLALSQPNFPTSGSDTPFHTLHPVKPPAAAPLENLISTGEESLEAFNESYWNELSQSLAAAKVRELSAKFMALSQERLVRIEKAIESQQWQDAKRIIHDLGGSTGTFGLTGAGHITAQMERSIQTGHTSEAAAMLPQLKEMMSRGIEALEIRRKQLA